MFLSKGTNRPFGIIYEYLFTMFQDLCYFVIPQSFTYSLFFSYAILIPIGLKYIRGLLDNLKYLKRIKIYLFPIIAIIFLLAWTHMVRPALTGNLGGTFQNILCPPDFKIFSQCLKMIHFPVHSGCRDNLAFHITIQIILPVELSTLSLATTSAEFYTTSRSGFSKETDCIRHRVSCSSGRSSRGVIC